MYYEDMNYYILRQKLSAAHDAAHNAPFARVYEENKNGKPTGYKHISDHTVGYATWSNEWAKLRAEYLRRGFVTTVDIAPPKQPDSDKNKNIMWLKHSEPYMFFHLENKAEYQQLRGARGYLLEYRRVYNYWNKSFDSWVKLGQFETLEDMNRFVAMHYWSIRYEDYETFQDHNVIWC